MSLPYHIEQILTQWPGPGYSLGHIDYLQTLSLAGIRQGVFVETTHRPAVNVWHALIVFHIELLQSMVPRSFDLTIRHADHYLVNNIVTTGELIIDGINTLSVVTRAQPMALRFTNRSTVAAPMTYAYGYTLHYLAVISPENLDHIRRIWARGVKSA